MTDPPYVPCPASVIHRKTGQRIYCTVGPAGHWGTHVGDRSQADYDRLVNERWAGKPGQGLYPHDVEPCADDGG